MGRSSRNEIRHHEQVARHTRSRVRIHVCMRRYVPAVFRELHVVTFHFSQSLDPLLCALHCALPVPSPVSPSSLSPLSSSSHPQMKMFGQISGRVQSETPTQIFSVSAESRAITMGPHKSWRSGWSGCTAGFRPRSVNRYRVAKRVF